MLVLVVIAYPKEHRYEHMRRPHTPAAHSSGDCLVNIPAIHVRMRLPPTRSHAMDSSGDACRCRTFSGSLHAYTIDTYRTLLAHACRCVPPCMKLFFVRKRDCRAIVEEFPLIIIVGVHPALQR